MYKIHSENTERIKCKDALASIGTIGTDYDRYRLRDYNRIANARVLQQTISSISKYEYS